MDFLIGFAVIAALVVSVRFWYQSAKRKHLLQKYGDPEIVRMIMTHRIWEGQTEEQLRESLGHPVAVDHKVYKTKTKDVWKYDQAGKNRYNTRVTLENGDVVGFEERDRRFP